jgi:hypothetical protein
MNPPNPSVPRPDDGQLKADIVKNIPVHQGASATRPQPGSTENIDLLMQDVGKALKKDDHAKPKHHFWDKRPDNQPSTFSAQPVPKDVAIAAAPAPMPAPAPQPVPVPAAPVQNQPQPAPAAKTKPAPAKTKSSAPVLVIFVTVIVTAGLIFAAYSAYK